MPDSDTLTPAQKAAETRRKNAEAKANGNADDTATDTGTPGATSDGRFMPDYGVGEALDELPEGLDLRAAARANMYHDLLQEVVDDEDSWGKWHPIATFYSRDGGKNAEKDLADGKRNVPPGEWEFKALRIEAEDDEHGESKVWSRLFARYMGTGD